MTQKIVHDEILQCFDSQRNAIEGHLRTDVKTKPYRWWCGVSNIWLVNAQGQLLCSKRSYNVQGNPGKWQSYFGGHVPFGLSFEETAIKELQEEVGLKISFEDLFLIEEGAYEENKQFYRSFVVLFDREITDLIFSDGEIIDAKWMDMDDYWNEKERNPDTWCNRCLPRHQKIILEWLASNKQK
jgi:8-oxo-dGTP pyrophosphatase MutT (NUDIX family)